MTLSAHTTASKRQHVCPIAHTCKFALVTSGHLQRLQAYEGAELMWQRLVLHGGQFAVAPQVKPPQLQGTNATF